MKKYRLPKNKRLLLACLLFISAGSMAQTIEKWYVNMPDILNPTMSKQNRMELLEYHKAGQGDSIANIFKHRAYLLKYDTLNQHITVKNTPSSTFEMKILNQADSTIIIGIIRTVCAPVCMSTIEFYDTAWNSIPLLFNMPSAIEWVDINKIPEGKVDLLWVRNLMDLSFVTLSFSDKDQSILAKNNTLDFISEADRKVIAPYVSDKNISFGLKGKIWQRN